MIAMPASGRSFSPLFLRLNVVTGLLASLGRMLRLHAREIRREGARHLTHHLRRHDDHEIAGPGLVRRVFEEQVHERDVAQDQDRKSTRLNSSHGYISY